MRKATVVGSLFIVMSLAATCVAQYAEAGQSGPQSAGRWIAIHAGGMFDGMSDGGTFMAVPATVAPPGWKPPCSKYL